MPSSPPKKRVSIRDAATTNSPSPSVIMAKTVPARFVVTEPKMMPKSRPPAAPNTGTSGMGTGRPALMSRISMNRDVAAQPEVDGMPE